VPRPRRPRTAREQLARLLSAPLHSATLLGRRVVFRWLDTRLERDIRAALPGERTTLLAGATRLTAAELNGDEGVALLRELAPDLLVVSGAPLLKPRLYRVPRLGTVNLHWGIAPAYRGQLSAFTALRLRDSGNVGMTVHYVDDGVDTGPVLAQGWPALGPADTLATAWAKTARVGATMLGELLEVLRLQAVPGERRTGPGLEVRAKDRRVAHHLRYGVDRLVLRIHPDRTQERIVRSWTRGTAPSLPAPRAATEGLPAT
jgi:methionyl-tRNA formyltransferase